MRKVEKIRMGGRDYWLFWVACIFAKEEFSFHFTNFGNGTNRPSFSIYTLEKFSIHILKNVLTILYSIFQFTYK